MPADWNSKVPSFRLVGDPGVVSFRELLPLVKAPELVGESGVGPSRCCV